MCSPYFATLHHALSSCALVCAMAMMALSCSTSRGSVPADPAPLEPAKERDLRQTLVGAEWRHTQFMDKLNARPQPLRTSQVSWTFKEDGTLIYKQAALVPGKNEGTWRLEGRNIIMEGVSGRPVAFRVEKWSDDEMIWMNYRLGGYYVVHKEEDAL